MTDKPCEFNRLKILVTLASRVINPCTDMTTETLSLCTYICSVNYCQMLKCYRDSGELATCVSRQQSLYKKLLAMRMLEKLDLELGWKRLVFSIYSPFCPVPSLNEPGRQSFARSFFC